MKKTIKGYVSATAASAVFRSNPESGAEAARKRMIERQQLRGKSEKKAGNKR